MYVPSVAVAEEILNAEILDREGTEPSSLGISNYEVSYGSTSMPRPIRGEYVLSDQPNHPGVTGGDTVRSSANANENTQDKDSTYMYL